MTRRAYALVAVAYVILALGAVVTFAFYGHQAGELDATNHRLVDAAIAYCQAGLQDDAGENRVLEQISRGTYHPRGGLDPICARIALMLRGRTP